jgi:hypothetical protein
MTVHTVFNPRQMDSNPNPLMDRSPGYGIIEFDRFTRKITLAVWPRREDSKPRRWLADRDRSARQRIPAPRFCPRYH